MMVPYGSGLDSLSSLKERDGMKGGGGKKKHAIRLSVLLNIVLICVIVFSIAPFIAPLLWGQNPNQGPVTVPPGLDTAEAIAARVYECVAGNPALTEEQCWDLRYHDTAILHGNLTLCDEIKGEQVRTHCEAYFDL